MSAKSISKEKNLEQKRKKKNNADESLKRVHIRLIPIWLRILIIIFLAVCTLVAGVLVGYAVIGDGKPQDALKKATWTHIIDLVKKEE